jgi:hypothetical protein
MLGCLLTLATVIVGQNVSPRILYKSQSDYEVLSSGAFRVRGSR